MNEPARLTAASRARLLRQADERDGAPLFTRDGRPKWAMRPHDVEQFVGVTRRWGPQGPAELAMHDAAERGPTIGQPKVAGVCGLCLSTT